MNTEILLQNQKTYFATGATLSAKVRKRALLKLREAINTYEEPLYEALRKDLGKSRMESYMCEIGLVKSELSFMLRHMAGFAREKQVSTPLALYVSRCFEKPSPYGCVLIVSPWNYPFLLTIDPLIDALAAGNTVILKPSAYSPATTAVIKKMIESCFPPEYVAVVTGGREENVRLFSMDFNYMFFTGSQAVGKDFLKKASERLIPVTLELGGKSPCIVDQSANLSLAARSIVFGKFINCGQTCVAPDYIYCHESIKDKLIHELKKQIIIQYGKDPLQNKDYGKIINAKHFDRLQKLMEPEKIVFGGKTDEDGLRISPAIMDQVSWDDAVMQEEIFGPILPILTYHSTKEAIEQVRSFPEPLALYIFSSDKKRIAKWKESISFGGGCVNDTIVHLATSSMGFGGVGASGMGAYHGKRGFDTFTHYKSMVDKKTFLDLPMRYQPYASWKEWMIRAFVG